MRLTADVILRAHVSINPLRERELNLRGTMLHPFALVSPDFTDKSTGYKAPAIENLGVTQVQSLATCLCVLYRERPLH